MATILPIKTGDARYRFSTDLRDTTYLVRVRWNARDGAWYLDLLEADGAPIVLGVKVVLGACLAHHVVHPLFQEGVLVARDTSHKGAPPNIDDFGSRVQLVYLTRDDMIAELLGGEEREAL